MQFVANGQIEKSVVRDAAPQGKRQSGRQLDVRDAINAARRSAGGIRFDAEQKIRTYQHALQRGADSVVKISGGARMLVKAHERLHVVIGGRATIGAARETGQDLRRAGSFLSGVRGPADIEKLAAR